MIEDTFNRKMGNLNHEFLQLSYVEMLKAEHMMKLHHHYHHRKTLFLEDDDAKERERKIRHHIMDKLFWANLKLFRFNPFGTRAEGNHLQDRRRINDVADPLAVLRRNVHKAFTTSGGGDVDFFDDYIRGGR